MPFALEFVWIVTAAGAFAVGHQIPRWLAWRMFVIVPSIGVLTTFEMLCLLPRLIIDPGILLLLAYGIFIAEVLVGPIALILGGLGWMIVVRKLLALNFSGVTFIVVGTVLGASVGFGIVGIFGIFLFNSEFSTAASRIADPFTNPWSYSSLSGGTAGGFLVGYYAAKYGRNAQTEIPAIANA